jgi:hypothetical protein
MNPWSESRDQEGCLEGLTHGSLFIPSTQDLTGALHRSNQCDTYWVLAWVNVLVCCLVSKLVAVSSLLLFGARGFAFLNFRFPGIDYEI